MFTRWLAVCLVAGVIAPAGAEIFFFDNQGGDAQFTNQANWFATFDPNGPEGVPGPADLAIHRADSGAPAVQIVSDVTVDSFRTANGGAANHTAGKLTIANGVAGDNGLWIGEFGPASGTYTLNGGEIQVDDFEFDESIQIGRAGGSTGVFTFLSGSVTSAGGIVIGQDGNATWQQAGGTFVGAGVQIGRFASPAGVANLGGTTSWDVGLVLLADGHGVVNNVNGTADLNIVGPNVSFLADGLVMQPNGNLTFNGIGGGISTVDIGSGQFLLNSGELFLDNLPAPAAFGETLVLIDNIGPFTGEDTQFDNAPQGTAFGPWLIDYSVASQVRLVAVPEPTSAALLATLFGAVAVRRR